MQIMYTALQPTPQRGQVITRLTLPGTQIPKGRLKDSPIKR